LNRKLSRPHHTYIYKGIHDTIELHIHYDEMAGEREENSQERRVCYYFIFSSINSPTERERKIERKGSNERAQGVRGKKFYFTQRLKHTYTNTTESNEPKKNVFISSTV
jgi:hypothetical protein